MEINETKNLPTSAEIKLKPLSERNDSSNHRVYDMVFSPKEDTNDPNIENENYNRDNDKPVFGSVSTLEWLSTWRSLEIS